MPRLIKRKNANSYYCRANSRGSYATYQVTNEGVRELKRAEVNDGDDIPHNMFFSLLDRGLLYTGGTGIDEPVDTGSQLPTKTGPSVTSGSEAKNTVNKNISVNPASPYSAFPVHKGEVRRPGETVTPEEEGVKPVDIHPTPWPDNEPYKKNQPRDIAGLLTVFVLIIFGLLLFVLFLKLFMT